MRLSNYTPGFVESYDPATKLARVRIPGVTDGGEVFPEAMFSYPIGDKSEHTDIRVLVGDRVWLDFVNGDARFPIITGFRPKETDNAIDWRRLHHANIELQADTDMRLLATAAKVFISAGTKVQFEAGSNIEGMAGADVVVSAGGAVTINATSITLTAATITLDGPTTCTGPLTVQGLFSYLAGLAGSGGGAASANITGNVNVIGGEVRVDGIGVKTHHHTEHDGPGTSAAIA